MLTDMEWCSTRSRIALAMTWSPRTSLHWKRLVRGNDHGSLLVPVARNVLEEVRPQPVDGDVASLIDDQKLLLAVELAAPGGSGLGTEP